MKTTMKASNASPMMNRASLRVSNANPQASMADHEHADDVIALYGRKELNRELKDRKEREDRDALRKHRKATGRFLEHELIVQVWATLKTPESVNDNEWWDDAFTAFVSELQRRLGFTVGWIRADEAWRYRHLHVAIVSHRPVRLRDVMAAWLAIIGPDHPKRVWVKRYRPTGGGIGYGMKSDDKYRSGWQTSPNIELFGRSGDGKVHRPSTSRERRNARRILAQRQGNVRPNTGPSPIEPRFRAQSDCHTPLAVGVGCLKDRRDMAPRLVKRQRVDPTRGGRVVASCPPEVAA